MTDIAATSIAPPGTDINTADTSSNTASQSHNAPKITVHHLSNSRSLRILWMLEELKLPYEVKKYERGSDQLAPKSLKQAHPLGHAPVVDIEDAGESITLAESGAIVEYIIENYGSAMGPDASSKSQKAKYLYWNHFSEGSLMPLMIVKLIMGQISGKAPFLIKPIANGISSAVNKNFVDPRMADMLKYMESELKANGGQYFVGNKLTGADISISYPLEALPSSALNSYPTLKAYVARLQALPSRKAAEAKGGVLDFSAFSK